MFTPSRGLLFNKFKIHHPLPLSPRESTQLLNLLTSSFRQQLDTEHPTYKEGTGQLFKRQTATEATHKPHIKPRRKSLPEPWRPTDAHMHSLLANPLFNHHPANKQPSQPMELFDVIVAKGAMNIEYAKTLLKANKRMVVASSVPNVQEGLKEIGAGLKVLAWLISSGTTKDLQFLKDAKFATILIEHLVAEGHVEAIWSWIKRSFESIPLLGELQASSPQWSLARREIAHPLLLLVKAEASGFGSVNNAYMHMSRAAGYLKGSPAQTLLHILGPSGRFLASETILGHSNHVVPTASDFESFISLFPVMFSGWTLRNYLAHAALIHPTQPNVNLAMQVLGDLKLEVVAQHFRRGYIQLGLDSAKYLLETDRVKEATWVMEVLRVKFPVELGLVGVEQKKQLEEVKQEVLTMEILEGLSLA